ncbi:ABC transporter ATP-binding protein [Corticicoccus populi]|uniref:Putative hemin import ATP-binding protein HrtA n=1 Tax=Corticicoccus populi TaxID=1812821 RepID=A0ABW5WRK0_9STAP
MLKFENVTKTFNDGSSTIEAVKDTSFSLEAGEFVAIIGPSGSGKSTLLTMAGALQTPSDGEITIDGEKISQLSQKQLSKIRLSKIGFILQASNLVPFLTVEEQFKLLKKKKDDVMSDESLNALYDQLKLNDIKNQLPGEISGGQKQRAAIVKALYTNPAIILADEPTASLDTENALSVVKILKEQTKAQNKTCIIVTHDERLTEYCDKVFKMTDGVFEEIT